MKAEEKKKLAKNASQMKKTGGGSAVIDITFEDDASIVGSNEAGDLVEMAEAVLSTSFFSSEADKEVYAIKMLKL